MKYPYASFVQRMLLFIVLSLFIVISYSVYLRHKENTRIEHTLVEQESVRYDIDQLISDVKDIRLRSDFPQVLYQRDLDSERPIVEDTSLPNLAKDLSLYLSSRREQEIFIDFVTQNNLLQEFSDAYNFEIRMDEGKLTGRYKGKLLFGLTPIITTKNIIDGFLFTDYLHEEKYVHATLEGVQKRIDHMYTSVNADYQQSMRYHNYITTRLKNEEVALRSRGYRITIRPRQGVYTWILNESSQKRRSLLSLDPYTMTFKLNDILVEMDTYQNLEETILTPFLAPAFLISKKEIDSTLHSFSLILNSEFYQNEFTKHGFVIADTYTENEDEYQYPISLVNKELVGILSVDKDSNILTLRDASGAPVRYYDTVEKFILENTTYTATRKDSNKINETLSSPISEQDHTFFLIGTNEGLADTILYVNINADSQIRLVSIPRDLYYKGQRINWYFAQYSRNRFFQLVELLLGLEADHYAHIDMFALKEITDELGEIVVNLETPLVDPSYKVFKNGSWSTLYYDVGEHLLNGRELLQIVRSRYTTSDFSRSERQMLVFVSLLSHLRKQIKNNPANLIPLAKLILKHIETDMNINELMRLYRTHQAFTLTQKIILQTDNALESTYSNLLESGLAKEEVDDSFDLGAWILIPKKNDWNQLQSYIFSRIHNQEQ